MKKYYVCRNFNDSCGISKYGSSFYNSILLTKKYEIIHLGRESNFANIVDSINNDDQIWFEIGLASILEVRLLKQIIKKGNKNIIITIHDSPFLEYPVVNSDSYFLNIFFKLMQIIFLRKPIANLFYNYLNKVKFIFTLNPKGKKLLEDRFAIKNVHSIKHILTDILEPSKKKYGIPQILYFGFIGKNKGLEYALELHDLINKNREKPIMMKVIGKGIDQKSIDYLDILKEKFFKNVEYLGYVDDFDLGVLMKQDNVVFLPTKDYKFICPTSGSVLNSMKMLNVVFTTNVNSNGYIIKDEVNGFFLTGNLENDRNKVNKILDDAELREKIAENIYNDLVENYSPVAVNHEILKYEF